MTTWCTTRIRGAAFVSLLLCALAETALFAQDTPMQSVNSVAVRGQTIRVGLCLMTW